MAPLREIILDTETTGLDPKHGHRIIEIGAIELIDKRLTGKTFHTYLNPERDVSVQAYQVHGIANPFLADKPLFGTIVERLLAFIADSPLVMHNAPFDVKFLNHELALLKRQPLEGQRVIDTLALARKRFPHVPNNLDALCERFRIDTSARAQNHGALTDALLLAKVYRKMTADSRTPVGNLCRILSRESSRGTTVLVEG